MLFKQVGTIVPSQEGTVFHEKILICHLDVEADLRVRKEQMGGEEGENKGWTCDVTEAIRKCGQGNSLVAEWPKAKKKKINKAV